jgi:hypothetical protein
MKTILIVCSSFLVAQMGFKEKLYPLFYWLLKLVLVLSDATATVERYFSESYFVGAESSPDTN